MARASASDERSEASPGRDDGALVVWLEEVGADDTDRVGGKNASLGEMIQQLRPLDVRVPPGFATTAEAWRLHLEREGLDTWIAERLDGAEGDRETSRAAKAVRRKLARTPLSDELLAALRRFYLELGERAGAEEPAVAVRSSATAEDLPEASFAGQQETFLNVRGEAALEKAVRRCFASLFTDRAVHYRREQGYDHRDVALSVGVQVMVRSDLAGAGVAFTLDPESGFRDVVHIEAAFGLGEGVVDGTVDPDAYVVFKPLLDREKASPILERRRGAKRERLVYAHRGREPVRRRENLVREQLSLVLDDDEILELARQAVAIERHYGRPMDIEWAKDGERDQLFVVQARPETVHGTRDPGALRRVRVTGTGEPLVRGLAIGADAATGPVCAIRDASQIDRFESGAVLVTRMTDPDWVPIMKRAAAIVTDAGGRTSHAAIVSRELGVPAVVGAGDATRALRGAGTVTVSCAEGSEGVVYRGEAEIEREELSLEDCPDTGTGVALNLASPDGAFRWSSLPADGVGLARMEFIVNGAIQVHPMALLEPDRVEDPEVRERIRERTRGYEDGAAFFVDRLASGIARIAASQWPERVLVRLSDFKSNEYRELIGGAAFEPHEENPMLGLRGASRYDHPSYREAFALECRALRRVRDEIGLENVAVMVPFCRTLDEADRVLAALARHGLTRGRGGLEVHVMCEIPSNVLLAGAFAERFDGFSIGTNDLTQLVLGVDRDSETLAELFDERDPAVREAIRQVIERVHAAGGTVGLCGQAPSDDPAFARALVELGIDSMSVSPDSFLQVKENVAAAEAALASARRGEERT